MLKPRPIARRRGVGRLAGMLILGMLSAAGLGAWAVFGQQTSPSPSQDIVNIELQPDQVKRVRIYASQIADWHEGGEQVVLMRGKVWVEQDLVRLCMSEGVAWITAETRDGTTVYQVDIYGENADLQQQTGRRKAARVRFRTSTLEVLLKTFGGQLIQKESRRGDPLLDRALAVRGSGWARSASPRTLAAAPQDTPPPAAPGPPPALPSAPSSPPPVWPSAPVAPVPPPPPPAWATPPPVNAIQLPPAAPMDPGTPPVPAWPTPSGTQTQPGALPSPPRTSLLPAQLGDTPPPPAQPAPVFPQPGQPAPIHPPGGSGPASGAPAGPTSPPEGMPPIPLPGMPSLQPEPPGVKVVVPGQSQLLPGQAPAATSTNVLAGDPKMPAPQRVVSIRSRTEGPWSAESVLLNGEQVYIIPTGITVVVKDAVTNKIVLDIEADRMVYWSKDGNTLQKLQSSEGQKTNSMEFYLSGHVQVRNQQSDKESQTLRADEVYYDVSRNVAVAIKADVELITKASVYPAHMKADEIRQIGPNKFEGLKAEVFAAMIPSDPGIKMVFEKAVLDQYDKPRTNIFGFTYTMLKTGDPDKTPERIITGTNAITYVEGVPIMYFPKFTADANKPLGPLEGIGFNFNSIFGFQLLTTWNMFDILGIVPDAGKSWQAYADYMTARGPAAGTTYRDTGKDLFSNVFGWTNKYEILVKLYGIDDHGEDQIGGSRGTSVPANPYTSTDYVPVTHPELRGRATALLDLRDLPNDFRFLGQVSAISDQNYLDQFSNYEWLSGLNQETFAYLQQQRDFWYWSVMLEDRIRPWITETNWLPKLDAYSAGVNLLDYITWNTKIGAGYAQLKSTDAPPGSYSPTDQSTNTARADYWQDFSLPFNVGDMRLIPYVTSDFTYYSQDLAGEEVGRVYGGAGLRASIPFSRLFPDVHSDLFNLDGIFHKIVLSGNYYIAYSNLQPGQLPQLDRLNDDAANQALNNIHPLQAVLNPSNAGYLTTSPLFNPQFYALQRLVDFEVDTLGSIDVLQLDLYQRWQTKRGIAGDEHVVDWMTLDLAMTVFPQAQRDNFDQAMGILSYDWLWNIGDRTALFSNGWMDPIYGGPHFWTFGAAYNRPDKTNFTLAYRQIDPLDSKAIIASVTYPLSAKYAVSASSMYDFGVDTQTNTIMLTRLGTDWRTSVGLSYNSILKNFSFVLEIVPNLIPNAGKGGGLGGGGGSSGGGIGSATR